MSIGNREIDLNTIANPGESFGSKIFQELEPFINLKDKTSIFGYEALFRLEENDFLKNHEFLKNANKHSAGLFILSKMCNPVFKYSSENSEKLSININVDDILLYGFRELILRLMTAYGITKSNNNIIFEILENGLITDSNRLEFMDRLRFLRENGFIIAIDDLYSKNSTPKRVDSILKNGIDIGIIKLDGDYLSLLFERKINKIKTLTRYILEKKKDGIDFVAEKIENTKLLNFAEDLGVDYIQGYIYKEKNLIIPSAYKTKEII